MAGVQGDGLLVTEMPAERIPVAPASAFDPQDGQARKAAQAETDAAINELARQMRGGSRPRSPAIAPSDQP